MRLTAEEREARRQRDAVELTEYLSLQDDIFARKKAKDWSYDALNLTTRLLDKNPEFYTIWNYRRLIFLNGIFPQSTPEKINDLLSDDLSMTTKALKAYPKVYWLWNHRRWCLENVPEGGDDGEPLGWRKTNWDREMYIVERMLEADARNFHAWDYRRYVLASTPVRRPETVELAYTTKKIESNFSNFSAWHQRTKILPILWESGKLDRAQSVRQELAFVQNAMWSDPEDQSVWLYHRWLIGDGQDRGILSQEIDGIQELLKEQPDSKWCMESLVHYKSLLIQRHASDVGPKGVKELGKECLALLGELEALDPLRQRRYRDLAAGIEY